MTYIVDSDILDSVQLRIIDTSVASRARLLAWLNEAMRTLVADREWEFLKTVTTATPVGNQIDLSALTNYDRPFSFRNASFCLYAKDRISDEQQTIEVNDITLSTQSSAVPTYYKESGQVFTFFPGCGTNPVDVTYIKTFTDYTDTGVPTIFPTQCRNALIRMVLSAFYEFDADDRMVGSYTLAQNEQRLLRDWDNRQKPQVQYDPILGGRNYVNG